MKAARIDKNQPAIVDALRRCGARVAHTHMVGSGFPDLVCLYRGKVLLVEVKDGRKPPSARKLTPDEQRFHDEWEGAPLYIVATIDEAIEMLEEAE